MIHSYSQIFALGHRAIEGLFDGPVVVQEKVDGSQFSFGVIDGELQCRSKGQQIIVDAPESMFVRAVETAKELAPLLHPGWVYRCEYLQKRKHNALEYTRTPQNYLILYDICTGLEEYASPSVVKAEGDRLSLEVVPTFYEGIVDDMALFKGLLDMESCLGGTKVEGVVIKNYAKFGQDKKVLMGKYVRSEFAELNKDAQKANCPKGGDVISTLIDTYRTEARWQKAVQHLRERGELQQAPQDIGPLMREAQADLEKEEIDEIKAKLWAWAWPQIRRAITHGLPDWYKEQLAATAFSGATEEP